MSARNDLSKLLSSASLIFIGMVLSSGSKLVERVIVARSVTPSDFGTITILLAVLTIGSTLALTGLQQGVPRFLSRKKDDMFRSGVIATAVSYTFIVATMASILTFFIVLNYNKEIFGHSVNKGLISIFCGSILLYTMLRLGVSIIRGYENTIYRIVSYDILFPFTRLLSLVTLIFLGFELYSLPVAYMISLSISLVACYYFVSRLAPGFGSMGTHFRELITFSSPLVLATISSLLLTRTDTILLGVLSGTESVGYYEAAYPIANSLVVLLSAVGFLYLPMASRQDHSQNYEKLNRIYRISTKWVIMAIFPVFIIFVLYSKYILSFVFGSQYEVGHIVLILLSFAFYGNAAFGRSRETLSALGDTRMVMYVNLSGFLANAGLNIALIPEFGIIGASVASFLSFILINVFSVWRLKKEYSIHPFGINNIKMLTGISGIGLAIYILHGLYPGEILGIALTGLLGISGVVFAFVFLGCYQEEDKIIIDNIKILPIVDRFV